MLLPVIGLAIPLFKLVPPLYQWRIRRRILKLYKKVARLDPASSDSLGGLEVAERLVELERIDKAAARLSVPLGYSDALYKLRRDIALVRRQLLEEGHYSADDAERIT